MTREKAIDHLRAISEYYSINHLDPYEEYEALTSDELDAIHLAVKALGQEPIINKIRAEIEEIQTYDGIYIDRDYVLAIIDKYKAENEE